MFREKFIAKVPASTIESANFTTREWQRVFSIASWVRFRSPRPNRVSLILKFLDRQGAKELMVDSCETELETTILLSSNVEINGKGKVTDMSLYLQVDDNSSPYVIDELYVQNTSSDAVQQP